MILIDEKLSQLKNLSSICQNEISKIYEYELSINHGISHIAHYAASKVNRSISLNKSFELLFNHKIYSSAISIIRLQIDNCIRFYAISLCNPEYLLTEVINGVPVRKLKDRDGKKMTDAHLIKKIDEFFPSFKSLYEEISGFIHFSIEHLKINNSIIEKEGVMHLQTMVGDEFELTEIQKLKYLDNMIRATSILHSLVYSYRYDSQNPETLSITASTDWKHTL
jgi:hypothetical protein